MQRTLVLVRHAKAGWDDAADDHARPLTTRGEEDAPAAGRWIRGNVGAVDVIIASSAVRAKNTAELIAAELDPVPPVLPLAALYGAAADVLLVATREFPPDAGTIVLVGHNPGIADYLGMLSAEHRPMPTAAIAVLTWDGQWADADTGRADLKEYAVPHNEAD